MVGVYDHFGYSHFRGNFKFKRSIDIVPSDYWRDYSQLTLLRFKDMKTSLNVLIELNRGQSSIQ